MNYNRIQIAEHLKEEMKDCDFNSELGDVAFAFVDHDLKPEKDAAIVLSIGHVRAFAV